ncbi:Regulatory protein MarR [Methyloversatilis universalis FAM5]|uniref:Regulatory protein MarR n=1 Tax=Methyloversatilis universalis (strain ATCC BAA-1314 / DSM 25237 / JCM 13912 / CCUG 52030 / FAM5) TaxID=1000565 RepID=F5REQ4_METUF|nr:MarR family transcriptional regulator [Methyloversatilis universalis]EGK71385.1 Regulatory protein MarR [Methyloversatilis universalis FAM5]
MDRQEPGLGELLRHVGELVEQGAEAHYRTMTLPLRTPYRARYTPVLRALQAGATTVTDLTARTRLTQGAISQTVALLEADGLVERHPLQDGRKSGIALTAAGGALVEQLDRHWAATFDAIARLEDEIGHPMRQVLDAAARALERESFSARLAAVRGDADE